MIIQGVDPSIWMGVKHACKPGDEVILNDPTYHAFKAVLPAAEAKPVYWTLSREDGYKFDTEALKNSLHQRPSSSIFVTPITQLVV